MKSTDDALVTNKLALLYLETTYYGVNSLNDLYAIHEITGEILRSLDILPRPRWKRFLSFFSRPRAGIFSPWYLTPREIQQMIRQIIDLKSSQHYDYTGNFNKKTTNAMVRSNMDTIVDWFRICYPSYFPRISGLSSEIDLICTMPAFTSLSDKDLSKLSKIRRDSAISGIWRFGDTIIRENDSDV